MRIQSIRLKEYGPVKDLKLDPAGFELVFGPNESGKTALVEALINVLFKKASRVIRYGKPSDVRVVLEDAGRVFDTADKKSAPALPAAEIAGLQYVQSSQAELFQKDGAGFWDGMKLTLSQTGAGMTYARIIKKIYERVGLQVKEKNWTAQKKPLVQAALDRKANLEKYFDQTDEIAVTRKRAQALAEECGRLDRELQAIRGAKQYHSYRSIRELHDRYRGLKNRLGDYQRYEDRHLEEWRQLEAEKKSRADIDAGLERSKADLARLEKELGVLKHQADMIRHANLEAMLVRPAGPRAEPSLFLPILLFLIGVALLIVSFNISKLPFLRTGSYLLFAACVAAFLAVQYRRSMIRRQFYENELLLETGRLIFPGLKGRDELGKRIEESKIDLARVESALQEKKGILEQMSGGQPLAEIERKLNELRNKTGLAEFEDLRTRIGQKNGLTNEAAGLKAKLESTLEERDENRWPDLIEKMKAVKPAAPAADADPEREREVSGLLENKTKDLDRLRRAIDVFEASRERIFGVGDYRTALVEHNRLAEEVRQFDLEKRAALKAEEVLNGMSGELDEFILDIARGGRGLSENFRKATGRYREVLIRDRNFVAVDDDGREFPIDQLSSGCRDQLLLCFRMAALMKLFPKGTFLILDDAFIFSDWDRRRRLVGLLEEFAGLGNQVIYLTSDDHTRDLFAEAGAHVTNIG